MVGDWSHFCRRIDHAVVAFALGCCLATLGWSTKSIAQDKAAGPTRDELLKTFRDEFVSLKPGVKPFPARTFVQETVSQTLQNADQRRVEFVDEFAISKYEVTQEVWTAVMGSNPSRWQGPRNSVERLSYAEAVEFCRRMTKLLRDKELIPAKAIVRLPTECEWEYACRAGSATRYSFGDDVEQLDAHAWHTGNAAGNDPPVGALKANPWGLYDMHGYLWEWCLSDPADPESLISPMDEQWWKRSDGDQAVVRGGSWKDPAPQLTSGYRRIIERDSRDDAIGLRCVLIVPREKAHDE